MQAEIKILLFEDNPVDALQKDRLNTFSLTTVGRLGEGLAALQQTRFDIILLDLGDFLRAQGFHVVSLRSGRDFLSQASEILPDAVLMDIQLPEMDGLETIRRLRAHPDRRLASAPVIAVTALAMPGDRERCLEAGADEYLSKPVRLGDLNTLIRLLMRKKREPGLPQNERQEGGELDADAHRIPHHVARPGRFGRRGDRQIPVHVVRIVRIVNLLVGDAVIRDGIQPQAAAGGDGRQLLVDPGPGADQVRRAAQRARSVVDDRREIIHDCPVRQVYRGNVGA